MVRETIGWLIHAFVMVEDGEPKTANNSAWRLVADHSRAVLTAGPGRCAGGGRIFELDIHPNFNDIPGRRSALGSHVRISIRCCGSLVSSPRSSHTVICPKRPAKQPAKEAAGVQGAWSSRCKREANCRILSSLLVRRLLLLFVCAINSATHK